MKQIIMILSVLAMLTAASCAKKEVITDNGPALVFNSLVATDTVIKVNGITTITATATGSGLTYKWTATYGTFIGSGAQVQWTVCHKDKFTITCEVTDQNSNSEKKQIVIQSQY